VPARKSPPEVIDRFGCLRFISLALSVFLISNRMVWTTIVVFSGGNFVVDTTETLRLGFINYACHRDAFY